MASIYKPSVTRYLDENGKQVPKGTPGAIKKSAKSKVWRGRYNDASGKRCDVKLCSNKTAARQMLNDFVSRAEKEKVGLVNQLEVSSQLSPAFQSHHSHVHGVPQ